MRAAARADGALAILSRHENAARVLTLVVAIWVGSVAWGQEVPRTNSPVRLTVIRYCLEPFRAFEIVGTDVKGIKKLHELTSALRNHKDRNPAAKYEVLSEVKSSPKEEKAIVEAIARAGIALEHYWATHSAPAPGTPIGPHGIGYVDHIGRYKKTTQPEH
jgi:hypothetical protein